MTEFTITYETKDGERKERKVTGNLAASEVWRELFLQGCKMLKVERDDK